jgi:hypothetical protein
MERPQLAGIDQTADVDLIHFLFSSRKGPFRLWRNGFNYTWRVSAIFNKVLIEQVRNGSVTS